MSRQERSAPKKRPGGSQQELLGGRQAVLEALRRGKAERIVIAEGQKGAIIEEILMLAREKKVQTELLSRADFCLASADLPSSQGVIASVPPFEYHSLPALIELSKSARDKPFLVLLDHIEDPHNLGAVMRTADAAGVHGLIIPGRRAARVNATVRKVAAGAAERIPVALVSNLNQAAEALKKEGFWLYGAEAGGELNYYSVDYNLPLVLVFGSEGSGLSRLLRENCDRLLSIPMPGGSAGSLNISAAAAVLIYSALSKRGGWLS